MTATSKETLRREARRLRAQLSVAPESAAQAARHFLACFNPGKDRVVAGYWPMGRELDPLPLMETLLEQGNPVALPVIQKDSRVLRFARWDGQGDRLEEGPHKTVQPRVDKKTQWLAPDIVIVPLLAFDRRGGRLGQGGGYYDATLAALRAEKTVQAVGLAYAEQACLFNLPREAHDQRLDWVVTPQGAQAFGKE